MLCILVHDEEGVKTYARPAVVSISGTLWYMLLTVAGNAAAYLSITTAQ